MKPLFTLLLLATMFSESNSATHTVTVSNWSFSPVSLNIDQHDTVVFNFTSGSHTVTSTNNSWQEISGTAPASFRLFAPFTVAGIYDYFCSPHVSMGMVGRITVAAITRTDSPLGTLSLNPYPNPTEGTINFTLPENSAITAIHVTDIQGSLIYQAEVNGPSGQSFTVDLSENGPGIYFCNFLSKDVIVERKKIYFKK